jgi:hypothetical protein
MRKTLYALGMAGLTTLVLAVTLHAMGSQPSKEADCAAKNVDKKANGVCECKKAYVWDDKKNLCELGSLWCKRNFAKGSVYLSAQNVCACRNGFELDAKGDACVKKGPVEYGPQSPAVPDTGTPSVGASVDEVTLDDSDVADGSAQFDFESAARTSRGYPDMMFGGILGNGKMIPTLAGNFVEMGKTFDQVKECPDSGYASAGVTGATAGKVYCVKTVEGNYAKFEVLDAHYDNVKKLRLFKFKYEFQWNGIRTMP